MALFSPDALAGKRILITGGGTGLGFATATRLAANGAQVHLWGRRGEALESAVETINADCGERRATFQTVDIRKPELVDEAVGEIWAQHGPLTGLINNAAANFISPTEQLTPNGFQAITSTVMNGAFYTTHACGKRWIEQGLPGSVASILVTWVWTGSAYVVPSAMAKTAVHAMTQSLAVEWARRGIRVNAVAPGPFPTDYAWQMLNPTDNAAAGATQADDVPMGRYGELDELGNLVTFLMSDGCDYMTGATLPLDGGHHLAAPSTFAGLKSLTDEDWSSIREQVKAASAKNKSQRSV